MVARVNEGPTRISPILVRQVVRLYLEKRKRRELREQLKRGYREMATLNLRLAEEGLTAELESLPSTQGRS